MFAAFVFGFEKGSERAVFGLVSDETDDGAVLGSIEELIDCLLDAVCS